MFARRQRLAATRDIIAVLRTGKRRSASQVVVSVLPNATSLPRTTVIVDKKLSKRAVHRNLVRRRLRAALRELGLPAGDTVVRAQSTAKTATYQQLRDQLQQCLPSSFPAKR